MINGVIYTAITNEYDVLKQPKVEQTLPMFCFQNNFSDNEFWQTKKIEIFNGDPIRTARLYKLHLHLFFAEYEWSIWVNGSLLITVDFINFLNEVINNKHNFGVCKYAKRGSFKNCIKKQKDDEQIITNQINAYLSQGYPRNDEPVSSGVLVRKHNNPQVIDLMSLWWKEICNHSRRDQLSFNYVCWKELVNYWEIPLRISDNRCFRRNSHGR